MIITKHHIVCDNCHLATMEIKSTQIENVVVELEEAGWQTAYVSGVNPFYNQHVCPGCVGESEQKYHEGRREDVETDE